MKNLFLSLSFFLTQSVFSQFYYNDIISTADITRQMGIYKNNKVLTITGTATDEYGAKNNSFYELQEIKENSTLLRISRLDETGRMNTVYRFDDTGNFYQEQTQLAV